MTEEDARYLLEQAAKADGSCEYCTWMVIEDYPNRWPHIDWQTLYDEYVEDRGYPFTTGHRFGS
jgi:hypothetical protein